MSVFLQPIYSQTIGAGGVASINFNNIPQGFTDLKVVFSCRTSFAGANDQIVVRFNGDTGANYSYTNFYGADASATGTYRGAGIDRFFSIWLNGATSTANYFNNAEMYIPNYINGNFKSVICDSATGLNGTSGNVLSPSAALWRSASPITSMSFTANGNFVQYSTVTLYGISNVYDTAKPAAPTIGTVTDQAGFASVAFTANDSGTGQTADSYVVTSSPSGSTTYGTSSPIVTPAVLDTSYTYQVAAVNALGSSISSASSALTTSNSWASIASFVISSSTAAVNFSNIPQNYKHLALHITGMSASTTAAQVDMGFNADGSALYTFHQFYGANTTASSGSSAPRNDIPEVCLIRPNNQIKPSVSELFIYDYTDTAKFKTCYWYLGNESQTNGYVQQATGMYRSFSPVSAITLTGRGQSFGANSHIALYGIA